MSLPSLQIFNNSALLLSLRHFDSHKLHEQTGVDYLCNLIIISLSDYEQRNTCAHEQKPPHDGYRTLLPPGWRNSCSLSHDCLLIYLRAGSLFLDMSFNFIYRLLILPDVCVWNPTESLHLQH